METRRGAARGTIQCPQRVSQRAVVSGSMLSSGAP